MTECAAVAGIVLATSQWAANRDKHAQDKQLCLISYQPLISYDAAKTVFKLSLHSNVSWMLKGVGFWLKSGFVSVEFGM